MTDFNLDKLTKARHFFEDSDLTFIVELVDLNLCDKSFRDKIENSLVPIMPQ